MTILILLFCTMMNWCAEVHIRDKSNKCTIISLKEGGTYGALVDEWKKKNNVDGKGKLVLFQCPQGPEIDLDRKYDVAVLSEKPHFAVRFLNDSDFNMECALKKQQTSHPLTTSDQSFANTILNFRLLNGRTHTIEFKNQETLGELAKRIKKESGIEDEQIRLFCNEKEIYSDASQDGIDTIYDNAFFMNKKTKTDSTIHVLFIKKTPWFIKLYDKSIKKTNTFFCGVLAGFGFGFLCMYLYNMRPLRLGLNTSMAHD